MKLYYLRHQAAGILHAHPFTSEPTAEELEPLLTKCRAAHGDKHPKTGVEYWTKVVEIDTDKPGEMRTVKGACGCSAEEADKRASGYCPIRAGDHVPEKSVSAPGAPALDVTVRAVGHVENP